MMKRRLLIVFALFIPILTAGMTVPHGPFAMEGNLATAMTMASNSDFIAGTMPSAKKTFWMSQKYPTEFRGMDIGDVNGDGLNEIVTIDRNSVYIFQKKGPTMVLLQKLPGKSTDNYLGLDVYPLIGDKTCDIIVTNIFTSRGVNMYQQVVQSLIISWQKGKFQTVADNLPWIFRVITNSGTPRLLGQKLAVGATAPTGTSGPFDTPICEMVWRNGKVVEGSKMKVPMGLCVYGLVIDNLGEGKDKIIALSKYDHLIVMEETTESMPKIERIFGGKKILYESDDVFGGSNIFISLYGQGELGDANTEFNYYFSPRILTYDLNKSGKRQVFIARNDAPSGRLFRSVREFTSTEFVCFSWESIGLAENWRTRKLSGYAADYQIKDADNDGEDEIAIALVTSSTALTSKNSVIMIYKLSSAE